MGGIEYREKTDKDRYVVELIRSTNKHGVAFYAYLLLRKDQLPEFITALESDEVNLHTHGNVLASGTGHVPPQAVQELIESVFSDNL